MMTPAHVEVALGHVTEVLPVAAPVLPGSPQVSDCPSPVSNGWITRARDRSDISQSHHNCQNSRSMVMDPSTGQGICSFQYSSALLSPYTRLPLSSNLFPSGDPCQPRLQLTSSSLNRGRPAYNVPMEPNGTNIRDDLDSWRSLAQPPLSDTSSLAFYPYRSSYGAGGLDLGPRRKNATRESTNTLKAWLQEHIKNPYPTKGEKIMLAIITKMTLTQVSTWFANARRRLKKDDKLAWSPRHRSDDCDDDEEGDCTVCVDEKQEGYSLSREQDESIDVDTQSSDVTTVTEFSKAAAISNNENESTTCRLSPDLSSSPSCIFSCPAQDQLDNQKRKIWSVTDFLSSVPPNTSGLVSHKVNGLKSSSRPNAPNRLSERKSPTIFGGSVAPSDGTSPICITSQSSTSLQTSLKHDGNTFPYSLPAFGGILGRSSMAPTLCRLSPFQAVRTLRMDSTHDTRWDVPFSLKGV